MDSARSHRWTYGPGTVLGGDVRLDSLVAEGTTSFVYAATQSSARRVAVKILRPELAIDARAREVFLSAAYLANQVRHEGVIHAERDGVTVDGAPWVVTELWEGDTLAATWLREGRRMRTTHAVDVALGVLEVLAAVHAERLVHGALGLEHVLLSRNGRLRLCSVGAGPLLGLARGDGTLSFDVARSTFVAPEQALEGGERGSPRSDLFAVAALTFALVTGESVLDGAGQSFASVLPALAAPLAGVLDRALAFDPRSRWPSAMAMREALGDALGEVVRVKTGPMAAVDRQEQTLVSPGSGEPARVRGVRMAKVSDEGATAGAERPEPSATPAPSRGTTVLVVAGLSSGGMTPMRARVEALGLRLEPVLAEAALVYGPAGSSGREEALELASFALELADASPDLALSLLSGVDLIGEGGGSSSAALSHALTRSRRSGGGELVRLDAASVRLVEAFFRIGHDALGPVLEGERSAEGAFRQLLGRPTPFVGRDKEIAELSAAFSRAIAHQSAHAALVVAPPGFGKSRLVEEVLHRVRARHPELVVWTGAGDPMRRDVACAVAGSLVTSAVGLASDGASDARRQELGRRVAAQLGKDADDPEARRISDFLAEIAGVGGADAQSAELRRARRDATSMGDQMRFAFLDFLSAVASRAPLLVVLEDLQWADVASAELVGHALSLLPDKAWFVLAVARPEVDVVYPRLWPATRRVLGPLEREALRAIAETARAAEPTISERDGEHAVAVADGNPLLLEEILRARVESRRFPEGGALAGIVAARVDALDPGARAVLSQAAVFGAEFTVEGVAALLAAAGREASRAQVAAHLDELVRRELVVARPRARGRGDYAFRHALVREVAYAKLLEAERAKAHRSAGAYLERRGDREAAVLAEHFARADARVEAAAWFERSAAEALARSDVAQALDLAARGLSYGPSPDVTASLLATKAECHVWRLEYDEAQAAASEVIQRSPRGSALYCRALASLATALGRRADTERAIALAGELLDEPSQAVDVPSVASALSALVAFALRIGRNDLVRRLLDAIAELARAPGADPATIAYYESAQSWCAMFAGDFAGCLGHDREVVRRFQEACDLRNACRETVSIGYDLMTLGAYDDAVAPLEHALGVATRLGIARVVASAKHHLSIVALRRGQVEIAHRFAVEALELARAGSDPFAVGSMELYLGLVLRERGEDAEAERLLEDAIARLAPTPSAQAWPVAELARLHLARGEVELGLAKAEAAAAIVAAVGPSEEGDGVIRVTLAEALARAGRTDDARAAIRRALRRLRERSDRISDTRMRESFLYRVPEHARTLELASELGVAVEG